MRTIALMMAMLAATPAAAQLIGPPAPPKGKPRVVRPTFRLPDATVARDRADVDRQIDRGRSSGTLSRRESRRFDRENDQISTLAERYRSDGVLSDAERRELSMRAGVLRDQVNTQRLRGSGKK